MNRAYCGPSVSLSCTFALLLAGCSTTPEPIPPDPDPDISGLGVGCNELAPLRRVPPKYPAAAVEANQEGWSVARVALSPTGGQPERVEIIKASPPDTFERVTAAALAQWEFSPRAGGGDCFLLMQYDLKQR